MIFRKAKQDNTLHQELSQLEEKLIRSNLFASFECEAINSELLEQTVNAIIPNALVGYYSSKNISSPQDIDNTNCILSLFESSEKLDLLLNAVIELRALRKDGTPTLIIAQKLNALNNFGAWLAKRAEQNSLEGVRLIFANTEEAAYQQLNDKLVPIFSSNVIRMPDSTEIDATTYKDFLVISPQLQELVGTIRSLAENNVERVYLLGGPGTGKTSLAYYYWLNRNRGRFITVNLSAESTNDKAAMKSLLCGHVAGSFPGALTREGAFSFAEEGVCFLDESHGVTGMVMQVLMEALDGGQYLPYGATKKRRLDCAVLFASNRSWEALRDLMHPDEHARLGATVISIPDLSKRREDLMAVAAISLAKFAKRCTSWNAPEGFSADAWELVVNNKWRGNMRTLIRVLEAACIEFARSEDSNSLLERKHLQEALSLWEPEKMAHEEIYASF